MTISRRDIETASVARIVERLREAERGLTRQVDARQRQWQVKVRRGHLRFDQELREAHRRLKQSLPAYIGHGSLLSLLTAPVIYSLIIPLALLDLWTTAYQWVCFPIYGIRRVRRRAYFVLDRHTLAYLNGIEKMNCTFCSYANGLIAYVREVAARTEQYWCPIKHARTIAAPHQRYHLFFDYGDGHGYHRELKTLRHALRGEGHRGARTHARPRAPRRAGLTRRPSSG